jgi:ribosome-associated protein
MMTSLDKATHCFSFIKERKAIDPVLLDVGELTSITDYFIIASGSSTRQVQAIASHLLRKMRQAGFRAMGVEGEAEGQWVLADFGDVVVHLFYEPVREFYDLESLWIEAPRIELLETEPKEMEK